MLGFNGIPQVVLYVQEKCLYEPKNTLWACTSPAGPEPATSAPGYISGPEFLTWTSPDIFWGSYGPEKN